MVGFYPETHILQLVAMYRQGRDSSTHREEFNVYEDGYDVNEDLNSNMIGFSKLIQVTDTVQCSRVLEWYITLYCPYRSIQGRIPFDTEV